VILATNKLEAPPLFKLLATNFRKRDLAFGWYNAEQDAKVDQQLLVPKVPFLLVAYVDHTAAADKDGKVPIRMEPYQMPMKYKFMANFLESVASRLGRGDDQVCLSCSVCMCARCGRQPPCIVLRSVYLCVVQGLHAFQAKLVAKGDRLQYQYIHYHLPCSQMCMFASIQKSETH
jgi:hypothetical protein